MVWIREPVVNNHCDDSAKKQESPDAINDYYKGVPRTVRAPRLHKQSLATSDQYQGEDDACEPEPENAPPS